MDPRGNAPRYARSKQGPSRHKMNSVSGRSEYFSSSGIEPARKISASVLPLHHIYFVLLPSMTEIGGPTEI